MTKLKEKRIESRLTQREAADKLGVSLRSYISYENEEDKVGTPKYRLFLAEISEISRLDEEHGILTIDEIKEGKFKIPALKKLENATSNVGKSDDDFMNIPKDADEETPFN